MTYIFVPAWFYAEQEDSAVREAGKDPFYPSVAV